MTMQTTFHNGDRTAGIIGATGTTGVELARLLDGHPSIRIEFGTSRDAAGRCLTEVDPSAPAMALSDPSEVDPASVELVFLCLPHGASAPVAEEMLDRGARAVVDLSGDLRLADPETHHTTYGSARSEALAEEAVYGLPELHRAELGDARLVANPGCYATATALALMPLADAGRLPTTTYVDAKSGVSGAGRSATATTHFCSAHDDVQPYKVGRVHRHVPEVEQTLAVAGAHHPFALLFVPHLVPMERGILVTCAVEGVGMEPDVVREIYAERYDDEPFVHVLPEGDHARVRAVAHSNRTVISLHPVPERDVTVVACAIDNLGKGAAGQAIQNANLMLGLEETEGLRGF